LLEPEFVIAVHDEIITETGGLRGLAGGGLGAVEAALYRIEMHAQYAALTCALTYSYRQGIQVPRIDALEDIMVGIASGEITGEMFADFLNAVWQKHNQPLANSKNDNRTINNDR
jgi:death-on-curing protein